MNENLKTIQQVDRENIRIRENICRRFIGRCEGDIGKLKGTHLNESEAIKMLHAAAKTVFEKGNQNDGN
jgi:hypothetical protein